MKALNVGELESYLDICYACIYKSLLLMLET